MEMNERPCECDGEVGCSSPTCTAKTESVNVYCLNCGEIIPRCDIPMPAFEPGSCAHDWLPYGGPGPYTRSRVSR